MIEQINEIDCNIDDNCNKTLSLRNIIYGYRYNFSVSLFRAYMFCAYFLVIWTRNKIILY